MSDRLASLTGPGGTNLMILRAVRIKDFSLVTKLADPQIIWVNLGKSGILSDVSLRSRLPHGGFSELLCYAVNALTLYIWGPYFLSPRGLANQDAWEHMRSLCILGGILQHALHPSWLSLNTNACHVDLGCFPCQETCESSRGRTVRY